MPSTMLNWVTATSRPRRRAGEISAMYIGETTEAPPTPMPPTKRKKRNEDQSQASAHAHRRDEVEDGDRDQDGAAPEDVGRTADDDRADDRADEGARHGEAEPEAAQPEDRAQRLGRAGDDRRVEAEEEAPEGGDQGAGEERAGEPTRRRRFGIVGQGVTAFREAHGL